MKVMSWYLVHTNQTSFDNALPQAKLAVKDHYTFDFLELSDAHEERELEAALLANVQRFLAEMGPHFTFVGSQYRLVVAGMRLPWSNGIATTSRSEFR